MYEMAVKTSEKLRQIMLEAEDEQIMKEYDMAKKTRDKLQQIISEADCYDYCSNGQESETSEIKSEIDNNKSDDEMHHFYRIG